MLSRSHRWPVLLTLLVTGGAIAAPGGSFQAAGITEPILDVLLSSPVAGIINQHKFKEGAFVQEGQVILELDKRLEEMEVERRKLVMDARKKDLDDLRVLFANSKGVSKDELEQAELDHQLAVVEHRMAAEQLSKRILKAPFSGTITEFARDPGEATQAYDPLVRVVDTRQCHFVSNLEARAGAGLEVGQTVQLEVDTGASPVRVEGQITYLSPVVDPASGLLKVKVLFDNTDGRVRPGLAGRVQLK